MMNGDIKEIEGLIKTALEDVQKVFEIKNDLYEFVEEQISNDVLVNTLSKRKVEDWQRHFKLGGPITLLNGVVNYCLIRHFNLIKGLETGVSAGFSSTFLLSAFNKNKGHLTSVEISDDVNEVGKVIPEEYLRGNLFNLHMGISSLDFLRDFDVSQFDFFSHDSLHTLSHMTKEFLKFKSSSSDRFVMYIDDPDSDNFWKKSISNKLFIKDKYSVKYCSGKDTRLNGHLGGFLLYERC